MTLALAFVAGGARTAGATSIVVNGGFETGTLAGWTQSGNSAFNGVQCPGPVPAAVFEGNCSFFAGPVGSTSTLSQLLPTVIGQSYVVSFAWEPDGGNPSSFSAAFDGITMVSVTNTPASAYKFLSFIETATSSSTNLAFTFRDDPGFLLLDAVSVVPTPEPMTLSLVGLGLAGARLFGLRKKSTQA
jgi:hypothetical protein